MLTSADPLSDLRILLVEDNLMVAETIRDILEESGAIAIGPARTPEAGMQLAAEHELDGALLDINLAGGLCYPVAKVLRANRVPFLFLTGGVEDGSIPLEFRNVRQLAKPFYFDELVAAAARQFRAAGSKYLITSA